MVKMSCNAIILMFSVSRCNGRVMGLAGLWSVKGSLVLVPSSLHIQGHYQSASKSNGILLKNAPENI